MGSGQPGMSSFFSQHSLPALPLDILGHGLVAHTLQQHRVQWFIQRKQREDWVLHRHWSLPLIFSPYDVFEQFKQSISYTLTHQQERIRDHLKGKNVLKYTKIMLDVALPECHELSHVWDILGETRWSENNPQATSCISGVKKNEQSRKVICHLFSGGGHRTQQESQGIQITWLFYQNATSPLSLC